jgi:hypothetical protein
MDYSRPLVSVGIWLQGVYQWGKTGAVQVAWDLKTADDNMDWLRDRAFSYQQSCVRWAQEFSSLTMFVKHACINLWIRQSYHISNALMSPSLLVLSLVSVPGSFWFGFFFIVSPIFPIPWNPHNFWLNVSHCCYFLNPWWGLDTFCLHASFGLWSNSVTWKKLFPLRSYFQHC